MLGKVRLSCWRLLEYPAMSQCYDQWQWQTQESEISIATAVFLKAFLYLLIFWNDRHIVLKQKVKITLQNLIESIIIGKEDQWMARLGESTWKTVITYFLQSTIFFYLEDPQSCDVSSSHSLLGSPASLGTLSHAPLDLSGLFDLYMAVNLLLSLVLRLLLRLAATSLLHLWVPNGWGEILVWVLTAKPDCCPHSIHLSVGSLPY